MLEHEIPGLDRRIISADTIAFDTEWRVPEYLNERVRIALSSSARFEDVSDREQLEYARANGLADGVEYLVDKYAHYSRTTQLLREVANGTCGFVLFLYQFPFDRKRTAYGNCNESRNLGEFLRRIDIAERFSDVSLLWVAEPSYDMWPQRMFLESNGRADRSIRLELDDGWRVHVARLIEAATAIIVDGSHATVGLSSEVELIKQLEREDDTLCFASDDKQNAPFPLYSHEALQKLTSAPKPRPPFLDAPPATCVWVTGQARERCIEKICEHYDFLMQYLSVPWQNVRLPIDQVLDAHAAICYLALLLEDIQCFTRFCVQFGLLFARMSEDMFPRKDEFASYYVDLGRPRGFPAPPQIARQPQPAEIYRDMKRHFSGAEFQLNLPTE